MQSWEGRTLLLTATVRHALGNDLKALRKALSEAWRSLWAGKAGMRRRRQWGLAHTVRGLEVTHGANGWHPHLHVLAFVKHDVAESVQLELREAWIRAVERKLGKQHAPSFEHGLDVRETSCAEYLAKLGLEVASIESKSGRSGSRTPWQIAKDAAAGDQQSAKLWRAFCRDMLGARQLCWSKGAKDALGVRERSDQELAEEALGVGHVMAEWSGQEWDACVRAFPRWSSMVEFASEHEHAVTELNRLPLVKAQSPPGIVKAYRIKNRAPLAQRPAWVDELPA